jgi:hypothetical protein
MKFLNHNLFTGDITVSGITTLNTATGVTRATGDNSTHLATTAFVKNQGYATTAALAGYVPTSRTLSINGTTYDLSANRSWTISTADGYVSNVVLNGSLLEFTGLGSAFSGSVDLSSIVPVVRTVYEIVKNASGAIIYKGTPLAVVPGQTSGNVSDVVPADAADPTKMPAVFIANQNIADEAEGEAVLFGNFTGVDTSLYQSGTTVYVAPGGGWTATKPVWPNKVQNLGVITKQHPSNGAGIVTGVGRANDLPNLTAGKIWVGSANYPIESTTVHVDEANNRVGIGTTSPGYKLDVNGAINSTTATTSGTGTLNLGTTVEPRIAGQITGTQSPSYSSTGKLGFSVTTWGVGSDYGLTEVMAIDMRGADSKAPTIWMNPFGGNVGIGTTSPLSLLHIRGSEPAIRIVDTDDSSTTIIGSSSGYSYIRPFSRDFRVIDDVGVGLLTVKTGGSVGIGTTNPSSKFEVYDSANANTVTITSDGANEQFRIRRYSNTNEQLIFGFHSSDYGYIQAVEQAVAYRPLSLNPNGGNVGIGTTSPANTLHTYGASGSTIAIDAGGANNSGLQFKNQGTLAAAITYVPGTSQLHFYRGGDVMVVGNSNVGIGTTAPEEKLHVAGGNILISNGQYYSVESSTGGNYKVAGLTTGNIVVVGAIDYTSAGTIFAGGDNVSFTTGGVGGSTRIKINSSGNVGVGVDPVSGDKFEVAGTLRVHTGNNWDGIQIYSGGQDGYVRGLGDEIGLHIRSEYGNVFIADDRGKVAIGTTSTPQEMLHVNGNIRIDGSSTAAILETGDKTADEGGVIFEDYDLASTYGAFVDYVIYDTTRDNMRAGTFYAVWNTGQAVYTDTSTVDIGDTSNVVLYAEIDGTSVNLIVNGPTSFTIKYNLKLIK